MRIGTHKQKIIYEGDGILCMKCGKIGHTISQCGNRQDRTNDKIPTKPSPPKKKMERSTETNNGWEIVFNALNGINSPTTKGITPNLGISMGNFPKKIFHFVANGQTNIDHAHSSKINEKERENDKMFISSSSLTESVSHTEANNHYSSVYEMTNNISSADTQNLQEQVEGNAHTINQWHLFTSSPTRKNEKSSTRNVGDTQSSDCAHYGSTAAGATRNLLDGIRTERPSVDVSSDGRGSSGDGCGAKFGIPSADCQGGVGPRNRNTGDADMGGEIMVDGYGGANQHN